MSSFPFGHPPGRDRSPREASLSALYKANRRDGSAARETLVNPARFCWIERLSSGREMRVIPFFIQIKCQLGKSYAVANALADAEIASEIYSTAGEFDLLVKFYVEPGTDIGHFVNEKVQIIPGIQDTRTIITFKAF
jgi:DNA-binding Lrp family transcriptional regulator